MVWHFRSIFYIIISMKLTLLTYNTLFNQAFSETIEIIKKNQPDIVCLQEVDTKEVNLNRLEINGYRLADFANCFIDFGQIWGVATYYNSKTIRFINSKSIPLIEGFYELLKTVLRIFKHKEIRRTILKTNFFLKSVNKKLTVYNIHLSAISLNQLRLRQLNMIDFADFEEKGSIIMTGDFNFPVQRKKLERMMDRYQLKEATKNLYYTAKYLGPRQFRFTFLYRLFAQLMRKFWTDEVKLDYIFYRGIKNLITKRLDMGLSDHFPIMAEFQQKD